jgi:hypothetical protein
MYLFVSKRSSDFQNPYTLAPILETRLISVSGRNLGVRCNTLQALIHISEMI